MRVVFAGTPQFAVPSLQALLEDGHDITLVITQPDRPRGRGLGTSPPAVKTAALERDLSVSQPLRLSPAEMAADAIEAAAPEVVVVVAYGLLIPKWLLEWPEYGCVNLHASALPEYRGAAPIQRAMMDGRVETGLTTMLLDEGMDTGPVLMQVPVAIHDDDTAGSLADRMSEQGGELLVLTLAAVQVGTLVPQAQDDSRASFAPKIKAAERSIDWGAPSGRIHNLVRALDPEPGARTLLDGAVLKVWRTAVVPQQADQPGRGATAPGVLVVSGGRFLVATGEGLLELIEVQPEGKARMSGGAFLRGRHVAPGAVLGR